ncbi:uncharacterized protein BCR38DRAFT_150814 [Pseudomassariella vexata]|uniref:Uncharacterized protein n=1 Tax=Pseudomassariella vexata TaxID=1141098 RepID=A0A1Y2E6C2_9PEZI|nr:uncharacterized protein BCR38DRAFT_150814 [Pseudomassariella vexata]ORY67072.1 hypothetical protein BCR38DRAFT_150814 [Pseudomassariella vexata]
MCAYQHHHPPCPSLHFQAPANSLPRVQAERGRRSRQCDRCKTGRQPVSLPEDEKQPYPAPDIKRLCIRLLSTAPISLILLLLLPLPLLLLLLHGHCSGPRLMNLECAAAPIVLLAPYLPSINSTGHWLTVPHLPPVLPPVPAYTLLWPNSLPPPYR